MARSSPPATPRYAGVDVLRGLAIVSVVLFHVQARLASVGQSIEPLVKHKFFYILFENPINGVSTFFAISGFLITFTCLSRFGSLQQIDLRTFYRIRFARIAPLLLLILAVTSALHLARVPGYMIPPGVASLPRTLFAALTFHINWLECTRGFLPGQWDILWSLSVEEMFYLFFPLACIALRWKIGRILVPAMVLGLILSGPFARTVWAGGNPIWQVKSYFSGMDCIALGCLTALLADTCRRRWKPLTDGVLLAIVLCGSAVIVLLIQPDNWKYCRPLFRSGLWTTMLMLGVCAVMFGTVLRDREGRAWSAPLRFFGSHSYEVYMTHDFLINVVAVLSVYLLPVGSRTQLLWAAIMLALCAPLGWLTTRYVTTPMKRSLLRDASSSRPTPPRPPGTPWRPAHQKHSHGLRADS